MSELAKVIVRSMEDEDNMQISFTYQNSQLGLKTPRQFNFMRLKHEDLARTFARIQANIANIAGRKHRRKKADAENMVEVETTPVDVKLDLQGERVDDTISNLEAWKEGGTLWVGDAAYQITVNAPTVRSVSLPSSIMAGFPVYPKIELEFAERDECRYVWYKTLAKGENVGDLDGSFRRDRLGRPWKKAGDSFFLVTGAEDVGRLLSVLCFPRLGDRTGLEQEACSKNVVEAGPGLCPFDERHLYTAKITDPGRFRCVTYNILADTYADRDYSREVLFPYCPAYALDMDYRKQLLAKEILGYNADVICLQEVDTKMYHGDLHPVLKTAGLDGIFNEKGGQVSEGLACFFRSSKFRVLDCHGVILSEVIQQDPTFADMLAKISENENLKTRILGRTTSLQIILLECIDYPNHNLLVGNTHLYFHPNADHIRLIQASVCVRLLENMLHQYESQFPEAKTSILLSGDFNSCPKSGAYQFISTGSVGKDCPTWNSAPEENFGGIALSHTRHLASACGCPPYTNYTPGFQECLDYIFHDTALTVVEEVVPLPSHKDVTQHTAIPSITIPSDHLALVATLCWLPKRD